MSEAKHTPGPWEECRAGQCTCGIVWSIPGDFPVCTVSPQRVPVAVVHEHMADAPDVIYQSLSNPEEVEANARLIAAAPDMKEALKPLAFSDPDNGPPGVAADDWRAAVLAARAALSKAEGRS